jgi:Protein of unknown function (DUF2934)
MQTMTHKQAAPPMGHSRYSVVAQSVLERDVRHEIIAQAAYLRAERRGFAPGYEIEDWLAAEMEVDTGLTLGMYC